MILKTPGHILSFLLAAAGLILSSGCGESYICNKSEEIAGDTWAYQDTLRFDFDIADTAAVYEMNLDVTCTSAYPYHNLYVQFHTFFPSGKAEKRVVSLELAKPSGISNGECSGETCTVSIPLQAKAIFREAGRHTLAIEQYMRQPALPGLQGMRLIVRQLP